MPRKRRKPHKPAVTATHGDIGPDTAAQLAGATVTRIQEPGGTVRQYKRRQHVLEVMERYGKITKRQCVAGLALHDAYCLTETTGESPWSKPYVDRFPDWATIALNLAERQWTYGTLMRTVPAEIRGPVWHVAIRGNALRAGYSQDATEEKTHLIMLKGALNLVAKAINI